MGEHLIAGEFQSDKYPTTPRGKVPLSCKDPTAQDLLWEYAQRRRAVDAGFSADLEEALKIAGYVPPAPPPVVKVSSGSIGDPEREACFRNIQVALAGSRMGAALTAQIDSLACTVALAASDRTTAGLMLDSIGRDLNRSVDNNWDLVKEQIAEAGAPMSGGRH